MNKTYLQKLKEYILNHPALNNPFLKELGRGLEFEELKKYELLRSPTSSEGSFVEMLEKVSKNIPVPYNKPLIENLADELGQSTTYGINVPHAELARRLKRALGIGGIILEPSPGTQQYVKMQKILGLTKDPCALAGFWALEYSLGREHCLAIEGIEKKEFYGLNAENYEYHRVHAIGDLEKHAPAFESLIIQLANEYNQKRLNNWAKKVLTARKSHLDSLQKYLLMTNF